MATKFSDFIEDSYQNVTSNGYIAGYYTNEVQKTNVRVSFSSLSEDIESKTSGTWSATQYYLDDDGTTASREIFYNPSDDIDTEEVDFVSNDYMKHYTSGTFTTNYALGEYTNGVLNVTTTSHNYNPSADLNVGSVNPIASKSLVSAVSANLSFNNQSSTSGVLTENLVSATWDSTNETMTSAGFTNSYNPSANTTIATNTDPIALKSYVDSLGNKLELKSTYTYATELPTNPTKKQKSYIWIIGNETDTGVDKTYEYVWDAQKNAFVKIGMMRNDFSGTLSAKKYSSDSITANLSYNPLNTDADWGDLASTAFVNYRTSGVLKVSAKTATTAANYGVATAYASTSYNPSASTDMASLVDETYLTAVSSSLDSKMGSKTSGVWSAVQLYNNGTTTAARNISYNPSAHQTGIDNFTTSGYVNYHVSGALTNTSISGKYENGSVSTEDITTSYKPSADASLGTNSDKLVLKSYADAVSAKLDNDRNKSTSGVLTLSSITATTDTTDNKSIKSGSTTATYNPSASQTVTFATPSYVSAVSSALQTQIDSKVDASGQYVNGFDERNNIGNLTLYYKVCTITRRDDDEPTLFSVTTRDGGEEDIAGILCIKNTTYNSGILDNVFYVLSGKDTHTNIGFRVVQNTDKWILYVVMGQYSQVTIRKLVGGNYVEWSNSKCESSECLSGDLITNYVNIALSNGTYPSMTVGVATNATNATNDGNGLNIDAYYAKKTDLDNSKWQTANANTIQPKDNSGISASSGQFGNIDISGNVITNGSNTAVMVNGSLASNTCYFLTGSNLSAMGLSAYTAPDSSRWSADGNNTIVPKDKSGISATSGQFGNIDISGDVINNSTATAVMVKSTTLDSTKCYFLTGSNLSAMGLSAYTIPDGSKWSANGNYLWAKDSKKAVAQYLDGGKNANNGEQGYVSASYASASLTNAEIANIAVWKKDSTSSGVALIKDASKSGVKEYLGLPQQPMSSTTWANFIASTKDSDTIYLVY